MKELMQLQLLVAYKISTAFQQRFDQGAAQTAATGLRSFVPVLSRLPRLSGTSTAAPVEPQA
jgi:hypothetical protein